jgi:hypothetical protein
MAFAWLTTLLLVALYALYAAHPRRLYDQLNYHLVLGRIFLILREPIEKVLDSHIFFSSSVEYAFMWVSSAFLDDFFLISVGQTLIFLSSIGTIVAAIFMILRSATDSRSLNYLGIVALTLAFSTIPNNELIRIAKPDALTLSGTMLLFSCYFRKDLRDFWLLAAIACVVLSVKVTFAHALIAFFIPFFRLTIFSKESFKRWLPLLTVGLLAIAVNVAKSLILTGSPLYPMDSRWFVTEFSGDMTQAYWQEVAFTEHPEPFVERWLGLVKLIAQSPGLAILIPVLALMCFFLWKRGALRERQVSLNQVVVFLGVYGLVWPFFFRADIFSRFVAPATGALIVLCVIMLSYLPKIWFQRMAGLLVLLMLGTSNLEVMVRQVLNWNQGSTRAAMISQHPVFEAAEIINQTATSYDDLVLVDNPAVYFYNVKTLFSRLTPRESAVWQDFQDDPQEAVRRHRALAMVRSKTFVQQRSDGLYKYNGPFLEIWSKLADQGTIVETSHHQILFLNGDSR